MYIIYMLIHVHVHNIYAHTCTCTCIISFIHTDRPRSCTYLNTRLTFRSADSTGILEVCDELGQWSRVCADGGISIGDAIVACNQLGFDPGFPPNMDSVPLNTNPALSDGSQPVSFRFAGNGLGCQGTEQNLMSCPGASMPTEPPPLPIRRKRQGGEPLPLTCGSLSRIGCSGKECLKYMHTCIDLFQGG